MAVLQAKTGCIHQRCKGLKTNEAPLQTAATRSLLNTAKLMEDNPLLLRLKELESLERLVEKVGRIDLHAGEGAGLDALITKLVRLKADAPA